MRLHRRHRPLLIEPVWNRNSASKDNPAGRAFLLIEPVWNRNLSHLERRGHPVCLLIEPVWNRNFSVTGDAHVSQSAF